MSLRHRLTIQWSNMLMKCNGSHVLLNRTEKSNQTNLNIVPMSTFTAINFTLLSKVCRDLFFKSRSFSIDYKMVEM